MHDPGASQSAVSALARKVIEHAKKQRCAVFINACGEPVLLINASGLQLASTMFRYPNGLIAIYDDRAKLGDVEADITEAWPKGLTETIAARYS